MAVAYAEKTISLILETSSFPKSISEPTTSHVASTREASSPRLASSSPLLSATRWNYSRLVTCRVFVFKYVDVWVGDFAILRYDRYDHMQTCQRSDIRQLYRVECLDGSDFRAVPFGVEDVLVVGAGRGLLRLGGHHRSVCLWDTGLNHLA